MLLRALAALLLLALAACATGPESAGTCGLRLRAEVPVDLRDGRPFVQLDVGGRSGRFLLDTGAIPTAMTRRGAARLGVPLVEGGAYAVNGIGGQSVGGSAMLRGARLAGLALADRVVTILPDDSLVAEGGADGLLGIRDLEGYEWDIDLPHKRVGLYAGPPCAGEARPLPPGMVDARTSMTNWPGMDHLDPRSYLRVLIDGKPIVAMVDTGATHSLILLHKAASLGVTAEMLAADPTGQSRGVGPATVRTPVHRFAKVQIGGLEFSNVTMPVVDANNPEAATYLETGMFLGMDYLARHRVWLAHASRLVLVPSVAQ